MCGIAGHWGIDDAGYLDGMLRAIHHRGPDDEGRYCRPSGAFGMRRLSIIDLETGSQPVSNEDGSIHLVFNGEIYNYRRLREELLQKGHCFGSQTDTEVIVHLYEELGMECLQLLRGMFTFALYDGRKDTLFIARDRLGIKPLYYWQGPGRLVFGSEIKSILACPDVPRNASATSVDAYLRLRYVPGPESIFEGIRKLPAAHFLEYRDRQAVLSRYWKPDLGSIDGYSYEASQTGFDELFEETVEAHMVSDVPVGAFLSGGIDSSALVAAAAGVSAKPLKTFSVGFDWAKDETGYAREVAETFGTDHHEVICSGEDFGLLPKVVWQLDEPIGDAIVLPMYLVSRLASQHVKVVLSGEGADEILAGYPFHRVLLRGRALARRVPAPLLGTILPHLVETIPAAAFRPFFPHPGTFGKRARTKIADFLRLLPGENVGRQYRHLISLFDDRDAPELYTADFRASTDGGLDVETPNEPVHELNEILGLQYPTWLPDDILAKVDKTSMACSLEARVPFLDHRLVEYVNRLPEACKLSGREDKRLLRRYLRSRGLERTASRPKTPFYIPVDRFTQSRSFNAMLKECLSEDSVRRRGYFRPETVKEMIQRMGDGDFLYGKQVVSLLILELWHRIFIDQEKGWV